MKIHKRDGLCWATLPKPLQWRDRRVAHRFNRALTALIASRYPHALSEQQSIDRAPLLRHLAGKP